MHQYNTSTPNTTPSKRGSYGLFYRKDNGHYKLLWVSVRLSQLIYKARLHGLDKKTWFIRELWNGIIQQKKKSISLILKENVLLLTHTAGHALKSNGRKSRVWISQPVLLAFDMNSVLLVHLSTQQPLVVAVSECIHSDGDGWCPVFQVWCKAYNDSKPRRCSRFRALPSTDNSQVSLGAFL